MVTQFHILANISGSWQTTLNPHLNQDRGPTENGYVDFGGGVFPGKPGLLFRACNPVGAPAALDVGRDPNRGRLVKNLRWPPAGVDAEHGTPALQLPRRHEPRRVCRHHVRPRHRARPRRRRLPRDAPDDRRATS